MMLRNYTLPTEWRYKIVQSLNYGQHVVGMVEVKGQQCDASLSFKLSVRHRDFTK
jgi:hypothetical protein